MAGNLESRKTLGRSALILAMTEDRKEEERVKEWLSSCGYQAVATEVTGPLDEFKHKVIKNSLTAAVQTKVIKESVQHQHALVHAVIEASNGVMISHLANPSLKVKVGLVSDGQWLAAAVFGHAALSIATNHERAGLGMMHL
ncbi:MAG: HutP family protein [Dehalobacterium sp.]|jgi:hut operon positive regulator